MIKFYALVLVLFSCLTAIDIPAGAVSGNWVKSLSPYNVKGNITVNEGVTLNIEPGVRVVFDTGYSLSVYGTIKAIGSSADSIWFTGKTTTGWKGIRMDITNTQTVASAFSYCSFSRGKYIGDISGRGGALSLTNFSRVDVNNCGFYSNNAEIGGAIYQHSSYLSVKNSTFINNRAEGGNESWQGGGAIHGTNTISLQIENCIFANNSTGRFGGSIGLIINSTAISIKKCSFKNGSSGSGGAISAFNTSAKIEECNFIDNQSSYTTESGGGAIMLTKDVDFDGEFSLISCQFANNVSADAGGGIYIYEYAKPLVVGCLFKNNQAKNGGAIYTDYNASPSVINNTICSNNATQGGGGFYFRYKNNSVLKNNVIYQNNAAQGKQFYLGNNNCQPNISYSNIQGGQTAFGLASGVTYNGTYTNNIDADPLFTSTGNHPYSIQVNSPCKNAGTPDTTGLKLPYSDLAGFARVQDGRVDIGAYEYGTVLDIGSSAQKKSPVIVKSYPNPFNNRTQINFNLGDKSMVNLSVYNASGQKVKQLLSSVLSAGEHSIGFNADNLNTGVYFVRLKTADFSTETKVVLTK